VESTGDPLVDELLEEFPDDPLLDEFRDQWALISAPPSPRTVCQRLDLALMASGQVMASVRYPRTA
jgi:hypothetical protein